MSDWPYANQERLMAMYADAQQKRLLPSKWRLSPDDMGALREVFRRMGSRLDVTPPPIAVFLGVPVEPGRWETSSLATIHRKN